MAALVAVGCTSSDDGGDDAGDEPGTTTTTATSTADGELDAAGPPTFPDDAEPLPVDDAVVIGELDNGLRYYVRANQRPGSRMSARLVVDAGSALEADDQLGAAHYLEHMMFNGTESFPENELVRVLERFGAEFGPDVNAFTSFDETVYSLTVPTDDGESVETALDVLVEWASAATIDGREVDAERGVIVEEWRLRDQGYTARYFDGVIDRLLGGTPYADRLPIGTIDSIETMTGDQLRRFYEDWYRPDLMGVVVVGDIDPDEIVEEIDERFGALENPTDAPERPTIEAPGPTMPTFFSLPDPEAPITVIELNYPGEPLATETVGDLRRQLAEQAAQLVLVERLEERARSVDGGFFDAGPAANELVRAQRAPGVAVLAEAGQLGTAAEALLTEVERLVRFGVRPDELDRAVLELRAGVDQDLQQSGTRQDDALADLYVAHVLESALIASAEDAHALRIEILDQLDTATVDAFAAQLLAGSEPLVIASGPPAAEVPDEAELAAILDRVRTADIAPPEREGSTATELVAPPEPGEIVDRFTDDLGAEHVLFANGLELIVSANDIVDDTAFLSALSPGGFSVVDEADHPDLLLSDDLIGLSGLAGLDRSALDRYLSGRLASVTPFIAEFDEGLVGEAAASDLDVLFELTHALLAEPRVDATAVAQLQGQLAPLAAERAALPDLAIFDALVDARYGGDPAYLQLPPSEWIDGLDADRALALFRDRFDDPEDWVVALAGDVDVEAAVELGARWLGSLPAGQGTEEAVDRQPDAPDAAVVETVRSGEDPQGSLLVLFDEAAAQTLRTELVDDVLAQVVQLRLIEVLREELAATYSPVLFVDTRQDPEPGTAVVLSASGDPDGLDELSGALQDVLADLREQGPTEDELAVAVEQVRRELEVTSNGEVLEALLFYARSADRSSSELATAFDVLAEIDGDDVRDRLVVVVPADRYVEIRQLPAA
ncbi:MAG: insulinase family protein [Actinomycetota bacterium]